MIKEKPINAISLAGVLVSNTPWRKAHEKGMAELARKSGIPEVKEKTNSPDYFKYVEKALEKIYPDLSPNERIEKRRNIYFQNVIDLLEKKPQINVHLKEFLKELKQRYTLVILTTNNCRTSESILKILNLSGFFEEIGCSLDHERDDKIKVLKRLIKKIGKPKILVENKDKLKNFCKRNNIKHITFDIDIDEISKLEEEIL